MIYYTANCRDCDRQIVLTLPGTDNYKGANGLHARCGTCGRTEWAEKATEPQSVEL